MPINPAVIEQTLVVLKEHQVQNLSLINLLEENIDIIKDIIIIQDSVLLRRQTDSIWVNISSLDKDNLTQLCTYLTPEDKHFSAIEEWMVPVITKGRKVKWIQETMRLYFPENVAVPETKNSTQPVGLDDAEIINDTWAYKSDSSIHFVRKRIQKGIGFKEIHIKHIIHAVIHNIYTALSN